MSNQNITLEQLLEAGVHFGHQKRKWNPKMAEYIYGVREGIHIFDLAKTREALLEACEAVAKIAQKGGVILFVGTKKQARDIVRDAANKTGMPYIVLRWPGGFLTNFEQIKKSLLKLRELKQSKKEGKFSHYTKKEQLLIDREIARLERIFGGTKHLEDLPDMLFIVDTKREATAVKEAVSVGIPTVAIVDSNTNPDPITYPIPGNDDAVKSISFILDVIVKAIKEGQKKGKKSKK